ncbi:hypothetical protein GCM10022204_25950 [Microlunatus aurantiacus]|uniref:4,4'-diaponeurosporenoate glycosyltransferase n=1 Tax=Microlunatus aurantiacus TaxID=446786 RepID=A0ABP7DL16_9ACTN
MTSVVIAAHNEEKVVGGCLEALMRDNSGGDLEVVVVANGCTDATADTARSYPGVVVIELSEGSKPRALNAGDSAAKSFPRIYLDADIVVPTGCIRSLVAALSTAGVLAAVPDRVVKTRGCPRLVQAYFAVNERLPAYQEGLFGRGIIALAEAGRSRFDQFPLIVADDLYLDSLFRPTEKAHVAEVTIEVDAPTKTGDLLSRLERVRRGNAALRRASPQGTMGMPVRESDRWAWLREVVAPNPRLWPAGVVYGLVTVYAAVVARVAPSASLAWGRGGAVRR